MRMCHHIRQRTKGREGLIIVIIVVVVVADFSIATDQVGHRDIAPIRTPPRQCILC